MFTSESITLSVQKGKIPSFIHTCFALKYLYLFLLFCFLSRFCISTPVPLKSGENVIPGLDDEIISFKNDGKCWRITSTGRFNSLKMEDRTFTIEISKNLGEYMPMKAIFIATSQPNMFGASNGDFFYGRPAIVDIFLNCHTAIVLKTVTYRYLQEKHNCATETLYEQAENIFAEDVKNLCPSPCSPILMPKEIVPYCNPLAGHTDYDLDCAKHAQKQALGKVNNTVVCNKTQYEIVDIRFEDELIDEEYEIFSRWYFYDAHDVYVRLPDYMPSTYDYNPIVKFSYRLENPAVMHVYEEYYTSTFEDLIGVVGGTFGLFVGFAFSDTTFLLLDYFIIMVEAIKKFFKSKKQESAFKKTDIKKENPSKPIKKATPLKSNRVEDAPKSGQETNKQIEENSAQNQETAIKEENDAPPEPIEKPTVEELEMIEDAPKSGQETTVQTEENSAQNESK